MTVDPELVTRKLLLVTLVNEYLKSSGSGR
jgi:hypothetical protein